MISRLQACIGRRPKIRAAPRRLRLEPLEQRQLLMAAELTGTAFTAELADLSDIATFCSDLMLGESDSPASASASMPESDTNQVIVSISISDATVVEGDGGAKFADFVATLSVQANQPITVNYISVEGTSTAGSDYLAVSAALGFAPGVTQQVIRVPVLGDTLDELNETFFVDLSGPVNAVVLAGRGQATILDDDNPPALSIGSLRQWEAASGGSDFVFPVWLSAASGLIVTAGFSTTFGTADTSDLSASSGTLSFLPGETVNQITVQVLGDPLVEADETFFVNLNNAVNVTIAQGQGIGSIVDNEPPVLAAGLDQTQFNDLRPSELRVFDVEQQAETWRVFPRFEAGNDAASHVAFADITGDGVLDVIVGAGPNARPDVLIFDGAAHESFPAPIEQFYAYDRRFLGGVFVAAGDVDGDGRADIITGADSGGGPHVKVFSGVDRSELASYYAFNSGFTGGVRVAVGDYNGDNTLDVIAAAGPGGGPHVRVFHGATPNPLPEPTASFYAYDSGFHGGVYVSTGDFDGNLRHEIVTGAGPGGGPHVRVFSWTGAEGLPSFYAFTSEFAGGVRVATTDADGNGLPDIAAAPGPYASSLPHDEALPESGGAAVVRFFRGTDGEFLSSFIVTETQTEEPFLGGLFIAGSPAGGVESPLRALGGGTTAPNVATLSSQGLELVSAAALMHLSGGGRDVRSLAHDESGIADLAGDGLSIAHPDRIKVDVDAAGHGWFGNTTPEDDEEFALVDAALVANCDAEIGNGLLTDEDLMALLYARHLRPAHWISDSAAT